MEELHKLLTSPPDPVPAADNESSFVEIFENDECIYVKYEPSRMIEYVEDVSVPTTRWSYEAALNYLEETTKPCVNFFSLHTTEHWEHSNTILRTCTQFKEVIFKMWAEKYRKKNENQPDQCRSVRKKAGNSTLSLVGPGEGAGYCFIKDSDETQLYFGVQRNGLHIQCTITDHENIVYGQLLDYLKIQLDGAEFKELFDEIGWQHDVVMEENISNGVATTISVMNDTNIYSLEYWIPIMQTALCKMDMTLCDTSSWYLTDKALV